MKRLLTIATVGVLGMGAVLLSACSSGGGVKVYPNSLSATIKGSTAFTASGDYAYATRINGTVKMIAKSTANTQITISLPAFSAKAGQTLAINYIGVPAGASYDTTSNGRTHLAAYGTIKFTKVTPYLEGTFSYTADDSTKITEGVFKIKTP